MHQVLAVPCKAFLWECTMTGELVSCIDSDEDAQQLGLAKAMSMAGGVPALLQQVDQDEMPSRR
eukprot:6474407-Amphidinium_carterae.2